MSPVTILLAGQLKIHSLVADAKSIWYDKIGQGPSPVTETMPAALQFDRVYSSLKAVFTQGHTEFLHKPNPSAETNITY